MDLEGSCFLNTIQGSTKHNKNRQTQKMQHHDEVAGTQLTQLDLTSVCRQIQTMIRSSAGANLHWEYVEI